MARKNSGKEKRITRSIRIEPKILKRISKKYKTFQRFLDKKIELELRPNTKRKKKAIKKAKN